MPSKVVPLDRRRDSSAAERSHSRRARIRLDNLEETGPASRQGSIRAMPSGKYLPAESIADEDLPLGVASLLRRSDSQRKSTTPLLRGNGNEATGDDRKRSPAEAFTRQRDSAKLREEDDRIGEIIRGASSLGIVDEEAAKQTQKVKAQQQKSERSTRQEV